MHQIKFRIFDKRQEGVMQYDDGHFYITSNGSVWDVNENVDITENTVLMQFTGLKDKNGVEIYEGDFIKFWSGSETEEDAQISVVKWWVDEENNYPAFDLDHNMISNYYFEANALSELCEWCIDFYVIGNVHEHPHLLKGE